MGLVERIDANSKDIAFQPPNLGHDFRRVFIREYQNVAINQAVFALFRILLVFELIEFFVADVKFPGLDRVFPLSQVIGIHLSPS
jgi:hypothetical protein